MASGVICIRDDNSTNLRGVTNNWIIELFKNIENSVDFQPGAQGEEIFKGMIYNNFPIVKNTIAHVEQLLSQKDSARESAPRESAPRDSTPPRESAPQRGSQSRLRISAPPREFVPRGSQSRLRTSKLFDEDEAFVGFNIINPFHLYPISNLTPDYITNKLNNLLKWMIDEDSILVWNDYKIKTSDSDWSTTNNRTRSDRSWYEDNTFYCGLGMLKDRDSATRRTIIFAEAKATRDPDADYRSIDRKTIDKYLSIPKALGGSYSYPEKSPVEFIQAANGVKPCYKVIDELVCSVPRNAKLTQGFHNCKVSNASRVYEFNNLLECVKHCWIGS